jgi:hypothetical protein
MERDRIELLRFLDALENHVFTPLVTDHVGLIARDLREHASMGWGEVRGTLQEVRNWLRPEASPETADVDGLLASFGLTGAQLAAKLAGFFFGALRKPVGRVHNALEKWYKGVLEWANLLLGSLSRAFPPVDIIKEYKEFLELSIDYTGAASQR